MNPNHPTTAYRLERIRQAIADQPLHSHQIAAAAGISERWVKKYMDHLMAAEPKQAHVASWKPYGAHDYLVAMYRGGPGRDAAKRDTSPAQRKARYRASVLADPERRDVFMSRERARKRKPRRDPLMAALFGRAG